MELYAEVLLYGIPFFTFLIFLEIIVGRFKTGNFGFISIFDSISGLSAGLLNIIRDVLGIGVLAVLAYPWLVSHINIFDIGSHWSVYIISIIALDFAGYWTHRIAHVVNYFWNGHVVHHSSERYTLSCALRQPFIPEITVYGVFLIPAAILGVPAEIIAIIAPIHLFAQFWYHTQFIGNLGFLEYIIVTPEQHGIHHAVNKEYMDKNYSQIFNIWDRLFGTFQEPIPGVPPVYGLSRPTRTWNPFKIGLSHMILMFKDAWRTKNWKDKFTIWFKPTGWRPDDVTEKYPVKSIEDVYTYQEYNTNPSISLNLWSSIQFTFTLALIFFLFYQITYINDSSSQMLFTNKNGEHLGTNILIYGAFIFFNIYAYTSVMDKDKWSGLLASLSSLFGFMILYILNNASWFNIDSFIPYASYVISFLLILNAVGAILFSIKNEWAEGKHPELVKEF